MNIEPDRQREFPRVQFNRYVNLEFVSGNYDHCRVKNLSLTGLLIEGDFEKCEGTCCHVDIFQSGITTELNLQTSAKVVRKNDKCIAVEFTSMTYDSYMLLQATLMLEAKDPFVLEKVMPENCPFEVTEEVMCCWDNE